MPRVYKQQYTIPIPENATRTTTVVKRRGKSVTVEAVRFRNADNKFVVCPVVERGKQAGTHCRMPTASYYGWVDGGHVLLCTDKQAAEAMLADLIRRRERGEAGLLDPFAEHRDTDITEHVVAFAAKLDADGVSRKQSKQVAGNLRRVFAAIGTTTLGSLDASRVASWLAERCRARPPVPLPIGVEEFGIREVAGLLGVSLSAVRQRLTRRDLMPPARSGKRTILSRECVRELLATASRPMSQQTRNHYVIDLRAFGSWLVSDKRIAENPFAGLAEVPVTDPVHARGEFTEDEVVRLLATTAESRREFRGLTGESRALLYRAALATAFRVDALASLTHRSFVLDHIPPFVALHATRNKSRRRKRSPIPTTLADDLRTFLSRSEGRDSPVWPGTWSRASAAMIRRDMRDAGIPYRVKDADGTILHRDFHALRHTSLSHSGRRGTDLRTLQLIAGHASSTTTERYTHRTLADLAGATSRELVETVGVGRRSLASVGVGAEGEGGGSPLMRFAASGCIPDGYACSDWVCVVG